MVFSVCHKNASSCVHGNTFQSLEFTVSLTPASETPQKGSIRVENLDPVITGIRHKYVSLFIYSYTPENVYMNLAFYMLFMYVCLSVCMSFYVR